MSNILKIFNLVVLVLIVFGAISWGIWGFFNVEIIPVFFGPKAGRIIYCIFGLCGIYGVHIFVDYAKKEWRF
ncbi:MAG: hypothetical protein S4CHLAM6_16070 [Chlamydiae bacterium]|nr:hypothetical protein [Chlamydiota bacterium]